jgi:biotin carboxyl carrier protein
MAKETVVVPMVGKILSVDVKQGDTVGADQQLGSFESMKMEMPIFSSMAGKVTEVKVKVGDTVDSEQVFCTIEG